MQHPAATLATNQPGMGMDMNTNMNQDMHRAVKHDGGMDEGMGMHHSMDLHPGHHMAGLDPATGAPLGGGGGMDTALNDPGMHPDTTAMDSARLMDADESAMHPMPATAAQSTPLALSNNTGMDMHTDAATGATDPDEAHIHSTGGPMDAEAHAEDVAEAERTQHRRGSIKDTLKNVFDRMKHGPNASNIARRRSSSGGQQ